MLRLAPIEIKSSLRTVLCRDIHPADWRQRSAGSRSLPALLHSGKGLLRRRQFPDCSACPSVLNSCANESFCAAEVEVCEPCA